MLVEKGKLLSIEQRLSRLELLAIKLIQDVGQLLALLDKKIPVTEMENLNQDDIRVGTEFVGFDKKKTPIKLVAGNNGNYLASNGKAYPSLSAAAEGVYGTRRDGGLFWRVVGTGQYAKDVKRKRKGP